MAQGNPEESHEESERLENRGSSFPNGRQVTSVAWNSTGATLACAFGKLDTPLGKLAAVGQK